MHTVLDVLNSITVLLQQAGVASPMISATVLAIASIFKGLTGTGPSLREIADLLEAQLGHNDTTIRAEMARLEALPQPPAVPPTP